MNPRHTVLYFAFILVLLAQGCGANARREPLLKESGWRPEVRARLEAIINDKRGSGLPVVFDMDNTLLCRDIGEATLGVMVRDGILTKAGIPEDITPLDVPGDLVALYETFLESTSHHKQDPAPYLNAYAWLTQIMSGLTPKQVVDATKVAYASGIAEEDRLSQTSEHKIIVTPGKTEYRLPYFYPEMVELVAELIKADYDVWVISASNVWTVRHMITQVLNPKLQALGATKGVNSDHIIGISTLMQDAQGKLYKDPFLAIENPAYAALQDDELAKYKLTTQIVDPLSSFYGKSANILQWIGRTPYLVAGDSPNDHGMLPMGDNKLWITRLESPSYQKLTTALMQRHNPTSWMFQPTLTKKASGFVPSLNNLKTRADTQSAPIAESLGALHDAAVLGGF